MSTTEMVQERLKFYSLAEETPWESKWTMPEQELYISLLLECGYPPDMGKVDPIADTDEALRYTARSLDYYNGLEDALDKYYRPSCTLPVEMVVSHTIDCFIAWALAQGRKAG